MKRRIFLAAILSTAAIGSTFSANFARWEKEIASLEKAAQANPPPKNGILFVGSSSIRLWKTLSEDFPGLPVIRQGFGGSEIADSTHFAPRLIFPHAPKTILLYAGDNDIANGKKPADILSHFQQFVRTVRGELPESRIIFIAIKPSVKRWALVGQIREANALIRDYCQTEPKLAYADIFEPMLGKDGKPRPELLVEDGLHLSREGYALWAERLRPLLR